MSRVATASILLACAALALVGCQGSPTRDPELATATASRAMVTLTADQPNAAIPLPRLPNAIIVQLNVQDVENRSGQSLMIELAVADATTARHLDVGSVSLYPSNQGGVFTLRLLSPATDLVRQEPTALIVTVTPIQAGARLQPGIRLSLTVEVLSDVPRYLDIWAPIGQRPVALARQRFAWAV